MTRIGELIESATSNLSAAGLPDARLESEFLISSLLGISRAELLFRRNHPVERPLTERIGAAVARRGSRVPLAYVLEEQPFFDMLLRVTPDVLIPRPETELLAERALALLGRWKEPRVLDVGTGSGALALTVARHAKAEIVAVDISAGALSVARGNAQRLGVSTVHWIESNLFERIPAAFAPDLILANLPYIRSADLDTLEPEVRCEPRVALDGGADGFDVIRRLVRQAQERITPGGVILLETGSDQAAVLAQDLRASDLWTEVECFTDLAQLPRIVQATRKG